MKQIIFSLLVALSICKSGTCQSWGDSTKAHDLGFYSVEQPPKFPGGMQAYYRFISDNLKMPNNPFSKNSNRIVVIRICIDEVGKIVYARVEQSVNKDYDKAALKLIKKMPNWSPGVQNGHPVSTTIEIPLRFVD